MTGPNGNSIFLPVTGYRTGTNLMNSGRGSYLSSTRDSDPFLNQSGMWGTSFDKDGLYRMQGNRCNGSVVRPVSD